MRLIAKWSVLVIYQEERTREEAVRACDALVRRFWASANFDIRWLAFDELEDRQCWQEATALVLNAHLIVVSMSPEGALPEEVKEWIKSWVDQRANKEGAAIIGIGEKPFLPNAGAKFSFLRRFAHDANLDYLTDIPQQIGPSLPDDTESYTSRAETITKVMGQILSQPTAREQAPPKVG